MQPRTQSRRSHARVDVVDAADAQAYLAKNRPVVVRLPHVEAWLERWSPEAMEARFGEATIELEDAVAVYVGERARRREGLARAMRRVLAGDRTMRWKGLEFLSRVPAMRAELARTPAPHRALLPAGYARTIDVLEGVSIVAVIGPGMKGTPGIAARAFTALADAKINLIAIAQGSSELSISVAVLDSAGPDAVRALHAAFDLGSSM